MAFDFSADGIVMEYGPHTIAFHEVLGWDRKLVYQGPDYIHTDHYLHVRGVISEKVVWAGMGQDGALNEQDRNEAVGITRKMLKPRLPLKISRVSGAGKTTWFSAKIDSEYGPYPLNFKVIKIIGNKTMLVEFIIRFAVNECPEGKNGLPPFMLSNRWVMSHQIDRNFYQLLRVSGRAMFRGDALLSRALVPDDFRAWLVFPLLPGWRRTKLEVTQGMTGNEIEYTFIDEQTALDIIPPWVADADITHDVVTFAPGMETKVTAALGVGLSVMGAIAGGKGGIGFGNTKSGLDVYDRGQALHTMAGTVGNAGGLIAGALPYAQGTLVVSALGTPHASMADLASFVGSVAAYRESKIPLRGPDIHEHWHTDWKRKLVTRTSVHKAGPLSLALDSWTGTIRFMSKFWDPMACGALIGGKTVINPALIDSHKHKKYAPGDKLRGEGALVRLIAASIMEGCEQPLSAESQFISRAGGRGSDKDPHTLKTYKLRT